MSESSLRRKTRGPSPSGAARGDDALSEVRDAAAEMAHRVASGTREVKEQVMQKAAELTRAVADGVREEAEKFFDEQKGKVGSKIDSAGKAIKQAAHALRAVKAEGVADAADAAAGRFRDASDYIEERSLGEILSDAQDVARRHPGIVLGGLFLTGLLAARFVKASASREDSQDGGSAGSKSRGATSRRAARAR
jgi:hypothetical protein